eukprot:8847831-Alexandrium_andersonii.AAC.1
MQNSVSRACLLGAQDVRAEQVGALGTAECVPSIAPTRRLPLDPAGPIPRQSLSTCLPSVWLSLIHI